MSERRYALQPLCDALACSPDALKARLGLDNRQIALYLASGLSEARADQLAVKAGLPTHLVWPTFGYEECAECADLFPPRRKGHRFCSKGCRDREAKRRRWRSDPEHRARRQAYAREYRAAAASVLAAQKRAWVEANRERVRAQARESMRRYRARQRSEAA